MAEKTAASPQQKANREPSPDREERLNELYRRIFGSTPASDDYWEEKLGLGKNSLNLSLGC